MLCRRLRIVLSFLLNFSFCQNEKPFSFDQNENKATFTENLKLFQWFKMFHSFIDLGLRCSPFFSSLSVIGLHSLFVMNLIGCHNKFLTKSQLLLND